MFKLILAGLIFGLFFLVLRQFRRNKYTRKISNKPSGSHVNVSRCAICDVHIPSDEAVVRGNTAYCCPEHANQHQE